MPYLDSIVATRRQWMQAAVASAVGGWCAADHFAADLQRGADAAPIASYLQNRWQADGGCGWGDNGRSHLTPTWAVIGSLQRLGAEVPHRERAARFVLEHHPTQLKKLEQEHRDFDRQQIQSLLWLGSEVSSFRDRVSGWRKPVPYLAQYESHQYPVFRHQLTAFTCRALLGIDPREAGSEYLTYLESRRRPDGSFNNTPAADGSGGHVVNTWWGLEVLELLGRNDELRSDCIQWLQQCQTADGGFTWRPDAPFAATSDALCTWAGLKGLALLGGQPLNRAGAGRYLASLWNADGGCGHRPGWASNPLSTWHALDAQQALGSTPLPVPKAAPAPRAARVPNDLRVWSLQIESHGRGSPADAVELARSLGIQMWGAKNALPGWIERAQQLAAEQDVPVTFFVADEEYGTWVDVPGLGTYSHTSDLVAPADREIGDSLGRQGPVSWEEFRTRRLEPLQRGGGRLIWQFGENEELVRIYLDDSLARGGYAAISTFHFGNPDFTNSEPFLNCYRGQIPFVALQDAHGDEPWWFADMTTGFRTLFLAREATWEGWLEALAHNRVAAVRRDAVSGGETWMHCASNEFRSHLLEREAEWRWWDQEARRRPLVSLAVVRPGDAFEAVRPERGVLLRVRCARANTTQGLPKAPLSELARLSLDGREFDLATLPLQSRSGPKGSVDYFQTAVVEAPASGPHEATAVVRDLATGREQTQTVRFRT